MELIQFNEAPFDIFQIFFFYFFEDFCRKMKLGNLVELEGSATSFGIQQLLSFEKTLTCVNYLIFLNSDRLGDIWDFVLKCLMQTPHQLLCHKDREILKD